ncbi:MAG: hypothetical protein RLY86_4455 [Pseudomonadota bacterium]|jgi:hypothetical protein
MTAQILTLDDTGLSAFTPGGSKVPLTGVDDTGAWYAVTGRLSSDGVDDVVLVRADGSFAWYDLKPGRQAPVEHRIDFATTAITFGVGPVAVADADGDGGNDIIFVAYTLWAGEPIDSGAGDGLGAGWETETRLALDPVDGPTAGDLAMGDVVGEVIRCFTPAVAEYFAVDPQTGEIIPVWSARDPDVQLIAFADLDAHAGVDVLYQDLRSGELFLKNAASDRQFVTAITADPAVSVAAVDNFHGSASQDEILFYNAESREFSVWVRGPIDPTALTIGVDYFQTLFRMDRGWDFAGTGDLDGDGLADVIIANLGDFAAHQSGWEVPVAYFSSARQELVEIGTIDPFTIVGTGTFTG